MTPNTEEVVLRLSDVTKRFGDLVANDHISLELHRGEVLGLLGENGAGKTTLMSILFGHYLADEGSIEAFGQALPPGSPRSAIAAGIGMVHQHFMLVPVFSVWENVVLGAEPTHVGGRLDQGDARDRVEEISSAYNLDVDPDALVLHKALFDVVAIPSTLLDRMARDQPLPVGRFEASGQKTRMLGRWPFGAALVVA